MKFKIILFVALLLLVPLSVTAEEGVSSGMIFGVYTDFDAKESGEQNMTPIIGYSQKVSGRLSLVFTAEYGDAEAGNEYGADPKLLYYMTPPGTIELFMLLGPAVTWADINEDPDEEKMVTYLLAASGVGMNIKFTEQFKIWIAIEQRYNADYSVARLGAGMLWKL